MEFRGMNIFGRRFDCECGRTHRIQPAEVLYAPDAAARLADLCSRAGGGRRAAVIVDARTRGAAGLRVCAALSAGGWQVTELLVPDPAEGRSPVCDEETRDRLLGGMGEAGVVVSVGGGVLADLGRWVAAESDRGFVCFATAASMNGYTSPNVAAVVEGVRVLVPARPPCAVAADPEVIRSAPYRLTAAGLGDILARPVSTTDWYLNHLLFGDYYCDRAASLTADMEPAYLEEPEALRARSPQVVDALFLGLLVAGVAMTMAGTSAPCSGGEHLISHTLDMMSMLEGSDHDLHGRQVGVGTVLTSELYRRVLALESPRWQAEADPPDAAFWGALTGQVAGQLGRKVSRYREAAERLAAGSAWDALRASLAARVRDPGTMAACLRRAGAAWRAEHIGCSRERLLAAFLRAHQMRARFTILDLARIVGVMPGAAAEIVEAWA